MTWTFTEDVEEYAAHTLPLLERDPVRNTTALTVIDGVRQRRFPISGPCLFGWWSDTGAVSWTPPHPLLLAAVPDGSLDALVAELRARGARPAEVNGERDLAARFA